MIITRAIKLKEFKELNKFDKNVQDFLLDNIVRILPIKLKNEVIRAKRERKIRYRAIELTYNMLRPGLSLLKKRIE